MESFRITALLYGESSSDRGFHNGQIIHTVH